MSQANLGSAYLTVVPKFENLAGSVNEALGGVDTTKAGERAADGFSSGFTAKSGILIGAFSAVTTKAMDSISSSVSDATSRLDTLNNYPKVMQTLGYSASDAQSSISKMSEHLQGLPTALNDMASTVQGISAITGDLNVATDAGLALNDMLLASGSGTQVASAAMEQFRQMLAKGEPDMQDWRSLTSAMPGQMEQLAKAMLGPTANANDLYAALGGGGADATITMDQLMAKMVELDSTSSDGFTSFADQAKSATGGIQSSMDNMKTAVTRGVADILDAIGTDTIKQTLGDIGKLFENAMKVVGEGIKTAEPYITSFVGAVEQLAPKLIPAAAAVAGLAVAGKGLSSLSTFVQTGGSMMSIATGLSTSIGGLATKMGEASRMGGALSGASELLGSSMGGPLVAGIALGTAAIALMAKACYDAYERNKTYKESTDGLKTASENAVAPMDSVAGAFQNITTNSFPATKGVKELRDAIDKSSQSGATLAQTINDRTSSTAASIGLLETYKTTIDKYANSTNLTAQQQAELKAAVDGVNESCGTQYTVTDAVNGVIEDENGVIQTNTDAILANIDATEKKLRVEALSEDYKDTYKRQYDDLQTLKAATATQADAQAQLDAAIARGDDDTMGYCMKLNSANEALAEAQGHYDEDTKSLNNYSTAMGEAASGLDQMKLQMSSMAENSTDIQSAFDTMGISTDDFSQKLIDAGVTSEQMSGISQDAFSEMLANCGGNIDTLIGEIKLYNKEPIFDKDGNVAVDQTQLIDAQGNLYTWDGTNLLDKDGNAVVDDVSLIDAQGNAVTWNATDLAFHSATADVDSSSVQTSNDRVWWHNNNPPENQTATTFLNVIQTISRAAGNAAGGFRLNAAGGYRFHGDGAIATRAVPLDVVGEDGAEAIVPLTNKRYSEPFARTLAEQIGGASSNTYNITIDGLTYNDDEAIGTATINLLETLRRKAAMNVG